MLSETITMLEYPEVAIRGRLQPDYSATPTETEIRRCDVQPGASTELAETHRTGSAIRWTVFAPGDAKIDADSIVRVRGQTYQVDGDPMRWASFPSSRLDHLVILLIGWNREDENVQ